MYFNTLQTPISKILRLTLLGILILSFLPTQALAHDENGIFAPTMSIDEPTVGDELDIVYSSTRNKTEEEEIKHSHGFGMELSKVILPHFGVSIGTYYQAIRLPGSYNSGFDNIEIGGKYEFYIDYCQNVLLSMGLIAELGGTGRKHIGAHSSTSISPALYFGKGLGNLSDDLKYLQPIVITGAIAPTYCTGARKIEEIELGLTLQYRLRNLNNHVANDHYYEFLNYVIPIVELPLCISTESHSKGRVTGSVNPGILLSGKYIQFGLEATIPVNNRSGSHMGVLVQLHFFLDNIFNCT